MKSRLRTVSRVLPFGVAVLWDALTDPVLVQGWLAPVASPVIGGALAVAVEGVPLPGASAGVLRSVEPGRVAVLDLGAAGRVRFELAAEPPLPSGRSSSACTAVAEPAHDLAAVGLVPAIEARLDALHELLRGRPVDWEASAEPDAGTGSSARVPRLD